MRSCPKSVPLAANCGLQSLPSLASLAPQSTPQFWMSRSGRVHSSARQRGLHPDRSQWREQYTVAAVVPPKDCVPSDAIGSWPHPKGPPPATPSLPSRLILSFDLLPEVATRTPHFHKYSWETDLAFEKPCQTASAPESDPRPPQEYRSHRVAHKLNLRTGCPGKGRAFDSGTATEWFFHIPKDRLTQ